MTQHIVALSNHLASPIEGLLDFIHSVRVNYAKAKQVRATIKELSKLTDRELQDIGIARGDIWSIAHDDPTLVKSDANQNLKGWV